jgi:DNA-binding LacI/PurR family transcriptional regulator
MKSSMKYDQRVAEPDVRRLRLQDVAERVGVSAKTVSNAYRNPGQLRPELRQRILATADEMGYRGPDPLAAGLRRRVAGPIGILYANALAYAFDDPNTNSLLGGLSLGTQTAGRGLLLLPGSADPDERDRAIDQAIVDGVVASSLADDDPLLTAVIARRLPLVVIDQPRSSRLATLGAPRAPWVGIDDRRAADELADHVLALGHRRIGIVSFALRRGPTQLLATPADARTATLAVTRDRLAGYRDAAERHGIDWATIPITQGTDSTPEEGQRGAIALLRRTPRPTALICLSDRLAEGALSAAAELGLRVPDGLSIAGFDDAPNLAERLALTTVRQPSRDKGRHAAAALLALLNGDEPEITTTLPTELVVRGSTRSLAR